MITEKVGFLLGEWVHQCFVRGEEDLQVAGLQFFSQHDLLERWALDVHHEDFATVGWIAHLVAVPGTYAVPAKALLGVTRESEVAVVESRIWGCAGGPTVAGVLKDASVRRPWTGDGVPFIH